MTGIDRNGHALVKGDSVKATINGKEYYGKIVHKGVIDDDNFFKLGVCFEDYRQPLHWINPCDLARVEAVRA